MVQDDGPVGLGIAALVDRFVLETGEREEDCAEHGTDLVGVERGSACHGLRGSLSHFVPPALETDLPSSHEQLSRLVSATLRGTGFVRHVRAARSLARSGCGNRLVLRVKVLTIDGHVRLRRLPCPPKTARRSSGRLTLEPASERTGTPTPELGSVLVALRGDEEVTQGAEIQDRRRCARPGVARSFSYGW